MSHLQVPDQQNPSSRRSLLKGAVALGAAGALAPTLGIARSDAAGKPKPPAIPPALDYTSVKLWEEFVADFEANATLGKPTDFNDNQGALAWGQSYAQLAYLNIYEATGQRKYLDQLCERIEMVLDTRDNVRGVQEYRGLSLPAWRADDPYTVGWVRIPDTSGKPTLEVRNPLNCLGCEVTVSPMSVAGTFTLRLHHPTAGTTDEYTELSMDPANPRYVVKVLYDAFPGGNYDATARDMRPQPSGNVNLSPGTYISEWAPVHFGVHTGMITHPMATTARFILESRSLSRIPHYRAKAETYIQACLDALAVHEDEWRENDKGEGWYIFRKEMPAKYDGTEQPCNQFLALGRTYAELARITGDAGHRSKVEKMARTFKNELRVDAGGGYTWAYWLTWGHMYQGYVQADNISSVTPTYCCATQIEDISHGHIDVDFAVKSREVDLVFNDLDLQRFAKAFTQNVLYQRDGKPSAHVNVDGTGAGTATWELLSALWMPVTPWGRGVYDGVSDIYNQTLKPQVGKMRTGSAVLSLAGLIWANDLFRHDN